MNLSNGEDFAEQALDTSRSDLIIGNYERLIMLKEECEKQVNHISKDDLEDYKVDESNY